MKALTWFNVIMFAWCVYWVIEFYKHSFRVGAAFMVFLAAFNAWMAIKNWQKGEGK